MKRFLLLLTLATATYTRAELTDGLLAAYLLDGNAQDASGHQQHGQVVDATFTADRFGTADSAVALDGQGAWVASPVDGQRHPLSLSFWFYLEARPGARMYSVLSSSRADAFGHGFIIGSGTNQLNANMAANYRFESRRWTHGVVTYGEEIRVYMGGELVASKPLPEGTGTPAGPFAIGRHSGSAEGHYFPGAIDDVLIYERVLSADEVRELSTLGPALAARLKEAEATRAQQARLTADAIARDGQRSERPAGLSVANGPLPLALTVSSIAEPGTNVWYMLDGDTNTAWTAAHDATGWWLVAEYEETLSLLGATLSDERDETVHAIWLTSENGVDWQPWATKDPVALRWLAALLPSHGTNSPPPRISELRVW